jgi:hypothetical protein
VVLNGIELNISRLDLLDRAVVLNLLPPTTRKLERKIFASFDAKRPFILGALLDAISAALRESDYEPSGLPRMADAAAVVMRAERGGGLPWVVGTYRSALERAETGKRERAIEQDATAAMVVRLAEGGGWKGLLKELRTYVNNSVEADERRFLPQTAASFGRKLSEIAPLLRADGIFITKKKTNAGYELSISHRSGEDNNLDDAH